MTFPVKILKNGFSLPVLGLGTWMIGGDKDHDVANDDARDIHGIQAAIDLGFTHIDTAELYAAGYAETLVGQAIAKYDREKIFLATKVLPPHMRSDTLRPALQAALGRLQTDYLDLYYLHMPNQEVPFVETAKALNDVYREGMIKNVAVSNFLPETLMRMQEYLEMPIVANQVHYNLMIREPVVVGLLEHAVANDYMIVAWRPLRFSRRNGVADAWQKGAYPILDEVALKYNKTNVQVAINWLISQPNVVTLAKSSNPKHLQEIIGSVGWQMTQADHDWLTQDFPGQKLVSDTPPGLA